MATFFGEIVESSSRAFLDDDDEEFDDNATSNVSRKCECAASWTGDKPSTAGQTFVIIEGFAVEAFAKQYLLGGADLIGSIEVTEENDRKRKIGQVYQLTNNILVCTVSNVSNTEAIPFVDEISDLINNAAEVLILTSLSLSQYRSSTTSIASEGFLCSLVTNPPPDTFKISCPTLEIPNIVSGVPAAVMTWCQREQRKACLLVYYTEVETCGLLDSRTMAPLMSLLSCEPLSKLPATSGSPPKPVPIAHEIAGNLYL